MSDLLLRTPLLEEQREFAVTVKDSAHALLRIINDILDFSKIEAGKLEIESIAFSPHRVTAGVTKLLEITAVDKGLTLTTTVSPRVPKTVRGDPTRLRQILVNLIGNAIKFTASGGVHVDVRLDESDGEIHTLCFSVTDTGIGISVDLQNRLFQEFAQGDGSIARRYGGTGLGLAISRRLVELMGGTISASNLTAGGATFAFTARFGHVDSLPIIESTGPVSIRHLRALIVDDDSVSRRALTGYLSGWGLSTSEADGPSSALELLQEAVMSGRPFDVVLLDYVMPQRDGLSLGQEILLDRKLGVSSAILVTAFDAFGRKEQAREAGFGGYLVKPLDPSALFDALSSVVVRAGQPMDSLPRIVLPNLAVPRSQEVRSDIKLLLAEDNKVNRRVALLLLRELGYEADVVMNGAEAIAATETQQYDLILMDMQMPEVDGLTASRNIRAAEGDTGQHITIIALTANALERDRRACIDAGMDDYLAKPLELESLRVMLERWLPVNAIG